MRTQVIATEIYRRVELKKINLLDTVGLKAIKITRPFNEPLGRPCVIRAIVVDVINVPVGNLTLLYIDPNTSELLKKDVSLTQITQITEERKQAHGR